MLVTKSLSYVKYIKISKLNNNVFEHFCKYITSLYEEKHTFKIIFDLSNIEFKDFLFSKKLIEFMKENKENTHKYIIKTAIIVSNKNIATFINNFIFSFYEPVHPFIITYSLKNAKDFLE